MGGLATLFREDEPMGTAMEAEVLMMGQDTLEDLTLLIMDAAGEYKNWTFIPSATRRGSESESESESESSKFSESSESIESKLVPLDPSSQSLYFEFESTRVYGAPEASVNNEINESDSAYFPDFEINCVDPDDEEIDFDGDIPKEIRSLIEREDERHAQPDLEDLIPHFSKVTFTHVSRLRNQFADALATLASMVEIPVGVKLRPIVIEQRDTPVYQHVMAIDERDNGHPWYYDIWIYVER
ncbi:hypothetical protein RHMOL_Rhmol08G0206000 [Rhododendron molle]|uniref:Uncharacterized protein n=1 Tax=Rhododendron molle TaxID=49168 RepID=A0ACC0MS18_RHOML|nr:hypothetical protein RHMOL_Rhmol08G0206000 [Rhododendron molle]